MQGKCQGCDNYGEVDDIMLCDSCAEDLENADKSPEDWAEYKEERKQKKWRNLDWSLKFLQEQGIEYQTLNAGGAHYRVVGVDFWPTTGKFYDNRNGQKGRGVKELLKYIELQNEKEKSGKEEANQASN